ncbi:MAG: ABC transporter ATP-binding protein [Pseudomonadota bacterium]
MQMGKFNHLFQLWYDVALLLRRSAPWVSATVAIVTLIETVIGLLVLYAIKVLVDTISSELSSGTPTGLDNLIFVLAITGSIILLAALFQSLANILRMRQGMSVSDFVDREIHGRAVSVGLQYYESPEYYDALERAREGGSGRPAQIVSNSIVTLRAAITILGILVLIGTVEYLLLPALVIPILIALVIRLHFARRLFEWRMSRAQKERRASYLDLVMTHVNHAKDLRLNGLGPHFQNQFSAIRQQLRAGEIKIEQARLWSEFSMAALGVCVFVTAGIWLLYQALNEARPIGDLVFILLLLRKAESSGKELVGNISNIVNDHLYLKRLFDFLSVPIETSNPIIPIALPEKISTGLELSNVSFRYDGAQRFALRNVSVRLNPGEVVAIVGENGSGKTTMIKLLTRLYDPTKGVVLLDGEDIRQFDPHKLRKLMSVVFQDYAIYADTVAENIRYGDVTVESSQDLIRTAARNAGAAEFIEALPLSYQTPLTKLFDNGQDLSIGQWQRIALARALFSKSNFLILDEPTSAMDPKAEFDLFENFKSRIDGRGALVISHRLSTVRQADRIYVLSNGEIAEQGTHDELIGAEGAYAQLFAKQAKHYT